MADVTVATITKKYFAIPEVDHKVNMLGAVLGLEQSVVPGMCEFKRAMIQGQIMLLVNALRKEYHLEEASQSVDTEGRCQNPNL